jgi:hypothetical protein
MAFESRVEDDPRRIVISALIRTNGFVCRAAHELGIPRRTFYRKLDGLRIWPAVNTLRKMRAENKLREADIESIIEKCNTST